MDNERAPLIADRPPAYAPEGGTAPPYPPSSEQLPYPPTSEPMPYPPTSEHMPYPPSSDKVRHARNDFLYEFPLQSAGNTVTVVTQPPPVVMTTSFGESPVSIMCPNCRNQVTTKTEYESGTLMWILVLVLCLLALWPYVTTIFCCFVVYVPFILHIRCCLIPFCVDGCKDVGHSCPVCNSRLGTYRRM